MSVLAKRMGWRALCTHGLIARLVNPSNEKNVFFGFSFLSIFALFWVFLGVFGCFFLFVFLSLEPVCIVVTHHM